MNPEYNIYLKLTLTNYKNQTYFYNDVGYFNNVNEKLKISRILTCILGIKINLDQKFHLKENFPSSHYFNDKIFIYIGNNEI